MCARNARSWSSESEQGLGVEVFSDELSVISDTQFSGNSNCQTAKWILQFFKNKTGKPKTAGSFTEWYVCIQHQKNSRAARLGKKKKVGIPPQHFSSVSYLQGAAFELQYFVYDGFLTKKLSKPSSHNSVEPGQ